MPEAPPIALTLAGSDCSAGAGIQADLKTFTALGCYGLTALTGVVSEVPAKVERIQLLDPEMIFSQIEVLARTFPIRAAKTGMLGGRAQIEAVLRGWKLLEARGVPLVVDPVMIATSGRRLLEEDALDLLTNGLFPRATLITPNLQEASALLDASLATREDMEEAARALSGRHGCAVLVKGGHLAGDDTADVLLEKGEATWFEGRRHHGVQTHGTGCTLSAAIVAGLCHGLSLPDAVRQAKAFAAEAIAGHFRWGDGSAAVDALNHGASSAQAALQPGATVLNSGLIL